MLFKRRALIVFDGDNFHAGLREDEVELHGHELVDRIRAAATGDVPTAWTRVMFVSKRRYRGEPSQMAERRTNTPSGTEYRFYPIKDGHGYPDSVIIRYLWRTIWTYGTVIVVTSDADFFATLRHITWLGKRVWLVCSKKHTSYRARRALKVVNQVNIEDLMAGRARVRF
ncbi:MAG TPA: hypothetical protein VLF67_04955 [Candidatus Saccharimonas sp.]|nr:hypothetical protein [Candidatus Saccharimonas sp.]